VAGRNPISAAQLGTAPIKEAKRIGRGTGKARPLRTVEIAGASTTSLSSTTRAAAGTPSNKPLSRLYLPPLLRAFSLPLEISVRKSAPCSATIRCDLVVVCGCAPWSFIHCVGFGAVEELAGHARRVRGWIEVWGKRRAASSSSVIGSGFLGSWDQTWRRAGTVRGMYAILAIMTTLYVFEKYHLESAFICD
jgi:hypothetical protein